MTEKDWQKQNQISLNAHINRLRSILDKTVTENPAMKIPDMDPPSALQMLLETFDLSSFERDLLLWCAAVELEADFYHLPGDSQNTPGLPTFSQALSFLPEAHWSALKPDSPLRFWRLIELGEGPALVHTPLRIDENILHFLAGTLQLDERLSQNVELLEAAENLMPSHGHIVKAITNTWAEAVKRDERVPLIHLCGNNCLLQQEIGAAACEKIGLKLYRLPIQAIPPHHDDRIQFFRLWNREVMLHQNALLIDLDDLNPTDSNRLADLRHALDLTGGPVLLSGPERMANYRKRIATFDINKPTRQEQQILWQQILGNRMTSLNGHINRLISQFDLNEADIKAAFAKAMSMTGQSDHNNAGNVSKALWEACRIQARPDQENLGQHIKPVAAWNDLILPPEQKHILHDIVAHVRQRHKVYEQWGFAAKSGRDLGISALFAGMSGTGKTMAAEVMANELKLDLYRIDLSAVVSKYIGETEKHLRRIFDAAEAGGAILLFDEADALFGKRTETKDSHDRYANIEVSYLLQRMEAYQGLAILTTNIKEALDTAFMRRIRFMVHFPFPNADQRLEIWQRIFPNATPTADLQPDMLAQLNVAGGNIRNIAMNSAFIAAEAGESVTMQHLLRAARAEYAKLERTLTQTEIEGWI